MEARLRLVEHQERRRARSEERRDPEQVAEGAIRELARLQRPQQPVLLEERPRSGPGDASPTRLAPGKASDTAFSMAPASPVSPMVWIGRGEVGPVVREDRGVRADLGLPRGRIGVGPELIVEAPARISSRRRRSSGAFRGSAQWVIMLSKVARSFVRRAQSPPSSRLWTTGPRRSARSAPGRRISPAQMHSRLIAGSKLKARPEVAAGRDRSRSRTALPRSRVAGSRPFCAACPAPDARPLRMDREKASGPAQSVDGSPPSRASDGDDSPLRDVGEETHGPVDVRLPAPVRARDDVQRLERDDEVAQRPVVEDGERGDHPVGPIRGAGRARIRLVIRQPGLSSGRSAGRSRPRTARRPGPSAGTARSASA